MRTRVRAVLAIVAAVLVAALVAPFIVGYSVEDVFRRSVARVSERLEQSSLVAGSLQLVDYRRGWFTATATLRFKHGERAVTIKSRIRHGPYLVPGWARVRLTPVFGARVTQRRPGDTDQPPITAAIRVGYAGALRVTLRSLDRPVSVTASNGWTLAWQGVHAVYRSDGRAYRLRLSASRLRLQNGPRRASVKHLAGQASGSTLAAIAAAPGRGQRWRAHARLALDRLRLAEPGAALDVAGWARLRVKSRPRPDDRVAITQAFELVDARLAAGLSPDPSRLAVDRAKLTTSLTGLNAAALARFLQALRQLLSAGDAGRDLVLLLAGYAPQIVDERSRLAFALQKLVAPAGRANARLVATLAPPGANGSPAGVLGVLAGRLQARLSAVADRALVETWLAQRYAQRHVEQKLARWAARGALVEKHGRYRLSMRVQDGRATLNGAPIDEPLQKRIPR